jgi:hypothetical protein
MFSSNWICDALRAPARSAAGERRRNNGTALVLLPLPANARRTGATLPGALGTLELLLVAAGGLSLINGHQRLHSVGHIEMRRQSDQNVFAACLHQFKLCVSDPPRADYPGRLCEFIVPAMVQPPGQRDLPVRRARDPPATPGAVTAIVGRRGSMHQLKKRLQE